MQRYELIVQSICTIKRICKNDRKKQKELFLPALINLFDLYYKCLNVSTKNASLAFIFSQKSA